MSALKPPWMGTFAQPGDVVHLAQEDEGLDLPAGYYVLVECAAVCPPLLMLARAGEHGETGQIVPDGDPFPVPVLLLAALTLPGVRAEGDYLP